MFSKLSSLTVIALALGSRIAAADGDTSNATQVSATADPHGGLFLQLTPGVGVAATAAKLPDNTQVSLSGWGGTFDLEIGGGITSNFILAADVSATAVVGPTVKVGSAQMTANDNTTWATGYAGVMAAYYIMPLDLRVAGGLGAFRQDISVPNMISTSRYGGAAKLAIGKEWDVSRKWGLGLNLEAEAGAIPDDATKDKGWGFFAADFAVSATYR
jgi:hypothetical protein